MVERILRLIVGFFLLTAGIIHGQEMRQWTSQSGSTVMAKLVSHTAFDVTLELDNSRILSLAQKSLSEADRDYIKKFPNLKSSSPSLHGPRVRISASLKSWGRKQATGYQKVMALQVASGSSEKLDNVEVYWVWVSHPSTHRIVIKKLEDTRFFAAEKAQLTLNPLESVKIETSPAHLGSPGVGRYEDGFIAQVYVDGDFVQAFTNRSMLKELAETSELRSISGSGNLISNANIQSALGTERRASGGLDGGGLPAASR